MELLWQQKNIKQDEKVEPIVELVNYVKIIFIAIIERLKADMWFNLTRLFSAMKNVPKQKRRFEKDRISTKYGMQENKW